MAGSMTVGMMAAGAAASAAAAKQQQNEAQKQNRQYYEMQAQELARQKDADVRDEEIRLNQARATHRARMAAAGIAPDDGSSGAVLDGLESTSEDRISDRTQDYNSALSQLNQNQAAQADESMVPKMDTQNDYLNGSNSNLKALQGWG